MRMTAASRAVLSAVLATGALRAWGADEDRPQYGTDYSHHEPPGVAGYPASGSLRITQKLVRRPAGARADALESPAADPDAEGAKSEVEKTAQNWIRAFPKGAGGQVTAEFYDEGSVRPLVVAYFRDTAQIEEFSVRAGGTGEGGGRVTMRGPDPEEASAALEGAAKPPGASARRCRRAMTRSSRPEGAGRPSAAPHLRAPHPTSRRNTCR
ncbi:hypothetical protein [Streptomyces virginiae]|uniref:hypothetical protein n=1 Tax=Streptomyces virginiae TaxID=1961 RepID=UPI0036FA0225